MEEEKKELTDKELKIKVDSMPVGMVLALLNEDEVDDVPEDIIEVDFGRIKPFLQVSLRTRS